MAKPPPAFPKHGTVRAKLLTVVTRVDGAIYRLSGGRLRGKMQDLPVLVLHHVGRKSGKARATPLLYLEEGEDILIVASRGGSDEPPAWQFNLLAMPETMIEIKGKKRRVKPRVASAEEKAAYWPKLTKGYTFFDDYQARTDRDIPVIVLTPVAA
jgi:deazaflavin-dependent oxidoreductase (nitroreductase family)